MESDALFPVTHKLDPYQFDGVVEAILLGIGANKYIELFKKKNIGQNTLVELSDEDLLKLGIKEENFRKLILSEVKNLPAYEDLIYKVQHPAFIGPLEINQMLKESSVHMYTISLSLMANFAKLKQQQYQTDTLVYKDKYASDVAIFTIDEIDKLLNSINVKLITKFKNYESDAAKKAFRKKIIMGSMGTVVIGVLAIFLAQSLREL